jgi:hypothetical protein
MAAEVVTELIQVHRVRLTDLVDDPVLATLYEPIDGPAWSEFVASIERSGGCRVPARGLTLPNGKVALWEGYQRRRAHDQLGLDTIKLTYLPRECAEWTEDQKVVWSEDLNENRRHLTRTGQARLYLAKVAPVSSNFASAPRDAGGQVACDRTGAVAGSHEAAHAAGFGSTDQAQRAARVVKYGIPELQRALDAKKIEWRAAIAITRLPKRRQRKALAKALDAHEAKASRRQKHRSTRQKKSGLTIPEAASRCDEVTRALWRTAATTQIIVGGKLSDRRAELVWRHWRAQIVDLPLWIDSQTVGQRLIDYFVSRAKTEIDKRARRKKK